MRLIVPFLQIFFLKYQYLRDLLLQRKTAGQSWSHPLFKSNCKLSNLIFLVVGTVGNHLVQLSQFWISRRLSKRAASGRRSIALFFASHLYSIAYGVADIWMWKAVWDGTDCVIVDLVGSKWVVASCTLSIGALTLTLAGAFRSVPTVPLGVVLDDPVNHFSALTYLNTTVSYCLTEIYMV